MPCVDIVATAAARSATERTSLARIAAISASCADTLASTSSSMK